MSEYYPRKLHAIILQKERVFLGRGKVFYLSLWHFAYKLLKGRDWHFYGGRRNFQ